MQDSKQYQEDTMSKDTDFTERKMKMASSQGVAKFRPESLNIDERTIEVIMTTGEGGKRYDWMRDKYYIEELRIDDKSVRPARLERGLSVLADHNDYDGIRGVIGVTENYRFEDGKLIGTIRFSKRDDVEPIFKDVADGILRNVSLRYRTHKFERITAKNDTDLDIYRAVDIEPLELSVVAIPFESTNGVRSLGSKPKDDDTYEATIIERCEEMADEKIEAQTDPVSDDARSVPATETVTDKVAEPVAKPVEVKAVNERALLQPMLDSVRKAGLDDDFAIRSFSEGVSLSDFNQRVLDEIGRKAESSATKITGSGMPSLKSDNRSDQIEQTRSAVEIALLNRADSSVELTDVAKQYRGLTLMEMARSMLNAQGINTAGMSQMQVAQRAMSSTSDFPLILENVMNKNLLSAYQEVPRSFQSLGRRASASDFRAKNVYRLGDAPDLLKLNEHGEYKSGKMSEGKESYAIDTYARKFAITRQTIINDDMDAFSRLPAMWGASAARLQNKLVWGLILNYDFDKAASAGVVMSDGKAVFHADHANLLTGAGSALSKTSLSSARQLGRKQKTLDGNKMNIQFNSIVVPTTLETTVEELLSTMLYPNQGTQARINMNLNIIVDPWLDDVSTTAWYMFANTNVIDTFEYAFLSGEQELYTETSTQTDVDGIEVKARTDFGCGWIDHRGVVKAVGA